MIPMSVQTLVWNDKLLEFGQHISDFETFFEVVVLVGIDKCRYSPR